MDEDFNVRYEANGNNKDIVQRFLVTNVSGVQADTVRHEYTSTNGYRLLDDSGSRVLFRAFTQRGFQLAQYGLLTVAATDGDTTPSVNSVGQLRLINSSPTSITTFDDSLPNQEFSAYFTNGNTTLVHSSALRLKGAVNVTPLADSIMTFTREPTASAYWVEKSRNF